MVKKFIVIMMFTLLMSVQVLANTKEVYPTPDEMVQMVITEFGVFPEFELEQSEATDLQKEVIEYIANTYGATIDWNKNVEGGGEANIIEIIDWLYTIRTKTESKVVSVSVTETKSGTQILKYHSVKSAGIYDDVHVTTASHIEVEGTQYGPYIVNTLGVSSYARDGYSTDSMVYNSMGYHNYTTNTNTRVYSEYDVKYVLKPATGGEANLIIRYFDEFTHHSNGTYTDDNSGEVK